MAERTTAEFAVRGAVVGRTPPPRKVIRLSQYLWIGTDVECFGWIDDLRTLRTLHAALGVLIGRRARTAEKRATKKAAAR